MKRLLNIMALLVSAPLAHAECPLDRIEEALNASLDAMKPLERDVTDVRSTQGGIWQIYRETDGRVTAIVRNDYGETGRNELRLGVVSRRFYGIASTRMDYFHHIFDEKPNAVARKITNYYYFCDGKLLPPDDDTGHFDREAVSGEGATEWQRIFGDKDVAEFTGDLAR